MWVIRVEEEVEVARRIHSRYIVYIVQYLVLEEKQDVWRLLKLPRREGIARGHHNNLQCCSIFSNEACLISALHLDPRYRAC